MAVNEVIVTGRVKRRLIDKTAKLWQRISYWTKASDVELDNGDTVETALSNINNKLPNITKSTLSAGATSIEINDSRITKDSALSFYSSIFGVNPTNATAANGSVTLTFKAQNANMVVGVRVDG